MKGNSNKIRFVASIGNLKAMIKHIEATRSNIVSSTTGVFSIDIEIGVIRDNNDNVMI